MADKILTLKSAVTKIEDAFGLEWLKNNSAGTASYPFGHPICREWQVAKSISDGTSGMDRQLNEVALSLMRFAQELNLVDRLPNYDSAIRLRLLDPQIFSKVRYEINVAALYACCGYLVEFVQPSQYPNVKTADLKLMVKGQLIFIECTQKDSYNPQPPDGQLIGKLRDAIMDLQRELKSSYEILVIVLGIIDPKDVEKILKETKSRIISGFQGYVIRKTLGCALSFKKLEPTTPGLVAVYLP